MMLGALLALLQNWALKDILPKLLERGGEALIAFLENLGGKDGTAEDGVELLDKLQPMANRIVASVQRDMPDAEPDEKRRAAFAHLGETLRKFDLRSSQLNMLIELAVQNMKAGR